MTYEQRAAKIRSNYESRKTAIREMKDKYKDDPEMITYFDQLIEKINIMEESSLEMLKLMEED